MASNSAQRRNNPFSRTGSQSPGPTSSNCRPKSAILSPPQSSTQTPGQGHNRNQSFSSLGASLVPVANPSIRARSNSKNVTPSSNTFAPSFIKTEEIQRGAEVIKGIEGENDFSGKRYVWLKDPQVAFVKGWIVEELADGQILVQCDDGSVCCPTQTDSVY
jgi:myosin heavy chain 9/10/11/14